MPDMQDEAAHKLDGVLKAAMSAASRRQSRNGMAPHDHPLPSGCAFSLRIDGRREGGYGAPQPPEPPRRGSTARADKESLSAPSASEPADGRARAESRGILIFPRSATPPRRLPRLRRVRRARRPRRAISAFSPPVDPQAERASVRKGMVMWCHSVSALTPGRCAYRSLQNAVRLVGGLILHVRHDVGTRIQPDVDRGVPKAL